MYHIYQFWEKPQRLILCGDLNSTPDSAIATFLRTGRVNLRTWPLKTISGRGYGGACSGYSVFGLGEQSAAATSSSSSSTSSSSTQADIEPIDQSTPLTREQLFKLLKCPVMIHQLKLESAYQNRLNPSATSSSSSKQQQQQQSGGKGRRGSTGASASNIHEPITSHFQQFSGTLDYIFYSPGLYPTAILNLPTDQEMRDIGFLPTGDFASDHLILLAQFQLGTKNS